MPLRHRRQAEHVFRRQAAGERRVADTFEAEQHGFSHTAVDMSGGQRETNDSVVLAKWQASNAAADSTTEPRT